MYFNSEKQNIIKHIQKTAFYNIYDFICIWFDFENRMEIVQSTILSVLDYGDIVYMYAAPSTLKLLDSVYRSAIRFVTGDAFKTHHCNLYRNVGPF